MRSRRWKQGKVYRGCGNGGICLEHGNGGRDGRVTWVDRGCKRQDRGCEWQSCFNKWLGRVWRDCTAGLVCWIRHRCAWGDIGDPHNLTHPQQVTGVTVDILYLIFCCVVVVGNCIDRIARLDPVIFYPSSRTWSAICRRGGCHYDRCRRVGSHRGHV